MKRLLMVIAALWLTILIGLVAMKEYALRTGTEVVLKTVPVDPRDLFRGDYVTLSYDISALDLDQFGLGLPAFRPGDAIYVRLAAEKTPTVAVSVDHRPPSPGTLFLKGRVTSVSGQRVSAEYGIESYFVPEGKGQEIERARGKTLHVKAAVDRSGHAIIKGLVWVPAPPAASPRSLAGTISRPPRTFQPRRTPAQASRAPLPALPFDFSVTHTPPREDVFLKAGTSGWTGVDLWHVSGDEVVTFSISGLPEGAQASIAPESCSPNCSPQLAVRTGPETPAGYFPITVTGTGGGRSHSTSFMLGVNVPPPPFDFSVTHNAPRADIVVRPGESGWTNVDLWHLSGSEPVSFSVSGLPEGATATVAPETCNPNCSPLVAVATSTKTPPGIFPITVTATGAERSHATSFLLTVTGGDEDPPERGKAGRAADRR